MTRAVAELNARKLDFLIPYSSIDYLEQRETAEVRGGAATWSFRPRSSARPSRDVSGGAGLVRAEFYRACGGAPEAFKGWGGEDNAWLHKAEVLGRIGWSNDPAQRVWHLYHSTSGAHDPDVAAKNAHYEDNRALLSRIQACRDPSTLLQTFPPAPPTCPWPRDAPIALTGDGALAALAASGLKAALGVEANLPVDDFSSSGYSAIVAFGASAARGSRDAENTIVVVADGEALPEDSQAFASVLVLAGGASPGGLAAALAPPLSHVVNRRSRAEPLTVWTYWEGDQPKWIEACLETIKTHSPRFRVLDRAGFERMRAEDRDIDVDRLEVAHRADFIRAYLLKHFGGLWIDADCIVMQPLEPLLDQLREVGFVANKDRQGYFPNGFIGAKAGSAIAAAFYASICAILRSRKPLHWISLGGEPLTRLLTTTETPFLELPVERIQPICWSNPGAFVETDDDDGHTARLDRDAICYMMSNTEIRKSLADHADERLFAPGSLFRFLIAYSAQ